MNQLKKGAGLEKYNLFPTEVYRFNINLDYVSMVTKLYNIKNNLPNRIGCSKGGWQSSDREIHNLLEFKELTNVITNLIKKIFQSSCRIANMWGGISSTGDYNSIHNHPPLNPIYTLNPFWSGVYYIKTFPNSGHLNIHSPINVTNYESISPIPGDLILFNSNTYHSVTSNLEKKDRIYIAFNLELL